MKGLVIAGGKSLRMRCDKATLIFQGRPLYRRVAEALRSAMPAVYLSARRESCFLSTLKPNEFAGVLFDTDLEIGPAAALLRAHSEDAHSPWLVIACDFPWIESDGVVHLIQEHGRGESEITCYRHEDGTPEPLFAVWTPSALARLKRNVENGQLGPMHTLRENGHRALDTPLARLLFNANTPADWKQTNLIFDRK